MLETVYENPSRAKVNILDTKIDRIDISSAVKLLTEFVSKNGKHQVAVIPVSPIMISRKEKKLRKALNSASLALPDGVPLLWASKLLGAPIPGRVAGSDLLLEFSKTAATNGFTFFFMGSKPGVPEKLAKVLAARNPKLRVVGAYAPPFYHEFPPEVDEDIIRRINSVKPDVLWVGLGAPKQENWIYDNLKKLHVKVAIGIGAAFDICSGNVKRAPLWMQKCGLEWFFRFLKEPGRLFRRYFIEAMPFIPLVLRQYLMGVQKAKAVMEVQNIKAESF
jgi:N-acetylglucosaminyldiphosphoundecaprenol N-acetyl-beta-D-mannosaminyltransferase